MKSRNFLLLVSVLSLMFIVFCLWHISKVMGVRNQLKETVYTLQLNSGVTDFLASVDKSILDSNYSYQEFEDQIDKIIRGYDSVQVEISSAAFIESEIDSIKNTLSRMQDYLDVSNPVYNSWKISYFNQIQRLASAITSKLRAYAAKLSVKLDSSWLIMNVIVLVACAISLVLIYFTSLLRVSLNQKHKLEKKLRSQNDDLEIMLKQFTHDIKNQLSGIISISRNTRSGHEENLPEALELIEQNTRHLDQLLNEMTDMIRSENFGVKVSSFDLKVLVERCLYVLQNDMVDRSVEFEANYVGNTTINSDEQMVYSILINLISNAVKYSDRQKSDSKIKLELNCQNHILNLTIWDNGIGIKESDRDKLFKMFSRLNKEIPGTGIGLFVVKRLVEKLGGEIKVNSEFGVFTEIKIKLPV